MNASAKYLIHATVRTSGVVERSDVVGAIFGQTEGLLGDQLDLRDLQESSKLGRIDVDIESEGGRSVGTITISSGLDRVETAVLAAALETIDRVGPCRAECTVTSIEDARAAKRRSLVERATELLGDLEETTVTSEEIVEKVRKEARVEEITEYEGFPAGPRVASSDAIVVVEGRADVRRLLKFGIRNAVAVEGTDVPNEIAQLTFDRNTTAFLDGDRGGDLILRELQQVGDVDYVAFAPAGKSVEDLDRTAILSALRRKVPLEQVADGETPREAFDPTESAGSIDAEDGVEKAVESDPVETATRSSAKAEATGDEASPVEESIPVEDAESSTGQQTGSESTVERAGAASEPTTTAQTTATTDGSESAETVGLEQSATDDVAVDGDEDGSAPETAEESATPQTLAGHVEAVIDGGERTVRLLDGEFDVIEETDAADTFEVLRESETVPDSLVIDGTLTQRVLDLAAQRGVGQIVAATTDEFVKQPTDVRVRAASDLEVNA